MSYLSNERTDLNWSSRSIRHDRREELDEWQGPDMEKCTPTCGSHMTAVC